MAGPVSARAPKPSTNSAWIRSTRHGSVWTQSVAPRESSRRWSVVLPVVTWPRRSISRPLTRRSLWSLMLVPRQPVLEDALAALDVLDGHVLVLLVREHRV